MANFFQNNYTVLKGDSLFKIAIKFNIKASKLMVVNNLLSDTLYEGQVLKVPSNLEGLENAR